jgi:hypothetical protein
VEWIGLIALVVILLKTLERGGNWFDFMDSDARYGNWWINFEFNAIFVVLCLAVFGGAAWILFYAMKPETTFGPSFQSKTVTSSALHVHRDAARAGKAQKLHLNVR